MKIPIYKWVIAGIIVGLLLGIAVRASNESSNVITKGEMHETHA